MKRKNKKEFNSFLVLVRINKGFPLKSGSPNLSNEPSFESALKHMTPNKLVLRKK